MSEPNLPEIDRVVHEPARLAILTVLASCAQADFIFLERATGLTRGNLSVQLTRLAEAGLVTITKTIERKRTLTMVSLASGGRTALEDYWESMEQLRALAQSQPESREQGSVPGRLRPAHSVPV